MSLDRDKSLVDDSYWQVKPQPDDGVDGRVYDLLAGGAGEVVTPDQVDTDLVQFVSNIGRPGVGDIVGISGIETEDPKPKPIAPNTDLFLDDTDASWRPTKDEAALPVGEKEKRLVDIGLHVLSDERRILVLAMIAMIPEGVTSANLYARLTKLVDFDDTLKQFCRETIERWFVPNGLAEITGRSDKGKHIRITPDGMGLIPYGGHAIDLAMQPQSPNLRTIVGQPSGSVLAESKTKIPQGRLRFEQLAYMLGHADETVPTKVLVAFDPTAEATTRTMIQALVNADWLVAVPSYHQDPDKYPLIVPDRIANGSTVALQQTLAVSGYLEKQWDARREPINIYDLTRSAPYDIRKYAKGSDNFRRFVFQEVARLCSEGHWRYEARSRVRKTYLAVNPAKLHPMANWIHIVRGAEQNSDRYQAIGLQKIAQRCAAPSTELSRIFGKA